MQGFLEFMLTRRAMIMAIFAVFLGAGTAAFMQLNIEAYPNPAPPILEIVAQNPGQSAEETERFVTVPIEVIVQSTPGLKYVRSVSIYGLSFVRVQFEYGTDYYFARQQTLNKLATLNLPNNVQPVISSAGGIAEIFRYQLKGPPGYSLMELKTLEEWVLDRRFKTVPGVADVTGWGGPQKEYHVDIDLNKLVAYNLSLPAVITAISNSNVNVGGRTLTIGQQSANVRGIGLIADLDDIQSIVLNQTGGTPILLSDIAKVEIGYTPRLGIAGRDNDGDVVNGTILMVRDEKTTQVLKRIEAEVEKINSGGVLPPGVYIEPYYDRGGLISVTIDTVLHNLAFGVVLIFVIQWLFLGNLRCAVIVAATIPFALLFATIITIMRGESANLLSVGAIDLGIIVDATVIMVENIFRNLQKHEGPERPPRHAWRLETTLHGKLLAVLGSAIEVNKSIFFSVTITIAAFIPLFTMQGVEGQIFGPMARTYAYALMGALIATFTVTPVLSSLLLPAELSEKETFLVRWVQRGYDILLNAVMAARPLVGALGLGFIALTMFVGSHLGTEFLPKLEEGNLWIRMSLPPTISLEAGAPIVKRFREMLQKYPEVITVISQHGRPDDGTDATGFFNAEFFVPLKPLGEWRPGLTKEKMVSEMLAEANREFIGVDFNFSQAIQDNVEESVSGVKGENSIKLYGKDLALMEERAAAIKDQMENVSGVQDLGVFNALGQPNLLVTVDRSRAARYGLAPGDVNTVVQAAIGGQVVTNIFQGERQFPLVVRLLPEYRDSIEAIRNIQVATPNPSGTTYVPLSELATVELQSGASYIYRENNERYLPIKFSVRGRDLGSTVAEAQDKVGQNVKLPTGYRVDWSGEFGALKEAQRRLSIIVPLSLLLILLLLYSLFNSLRISLLALAGIPFAVCGGIIALTLAGLNFSISAAVGFISLFGVSVMDGILMLSYCNQLRDQGMDRKEAITLSAKTRMRQMLMTALSACIGLLPAAVSHGIGSQVQQPLATVIVGGMLLEPIMSLIMIPVLGSWFLPKEHVPAKSKDKKPSEGAAFAD